MNNKLRYDLKYLTEYCLENNVKLIEDYTTIKLNRNSKIKGNCINCDSTFNKTFRYLLKTKAYCEKCKRLNISLKNKNTRDSNFLLKDTYPHLINEIHPTLNIGINLDKLKCCSNIKIVWICKNHTSCNIHIWESQVNTRCRNQKCPYCSSQKICSCNSIVTNELLLKEFAYDLNINIDPNTIALHSNTKFWWRCSNNNTCNHHIWKCTPDDRISSNTKCPFCSHHLTCICNSIVSNELFMKEFAYDLNINIDPATIALQSNKRILWRCTNHLSCNEHIWKVSPNSRTRNNTKCPFCYGGNFACKCNTFMNDQLLAKEFCIELNTNINPNILKLGSGIKITWKCSRSNCNNIWKTCLSSRTRKIEPTGCPKCSLSKMYSKKGIEYLEFIAIKYKIFLQHANNIGEFKIPKTNYKADGYCENTNTIYEFYGDYFHGNPRIFDKNDKVFYGKTFGELYETTINRENIIKNLGYNLVTIWENEWDRFKKSIIFLQKRYILSKK